jgi:SNF2 family DNA or RNA helicase
MIIEEYIFIYLSFYIVAFEIKHYGRDGITGVFSTPVSDFTLPELIRQSILTQIEFDRVVLDEAHKIQNHQTKLCSAVFILRAKIRWNVTGTS